MTSTVPSAMLWVGAIVAGVMLGSAYLLSPASVWFVVVGGLLVAWSGSGLRDRERRVVTGIVLASLFGRALVVAALFLATDHQLRPYGVMIGDEKQILERSEWLRNIVLGVPLAPTDWTYAFQPYGNSGLPYVYAVMHLLFGVSPYGAHLLNILMSIAGALVLHKVLRASFGPAPALTTLLLLLFVPTLFVWSVSALKESAYFFLAAIAFALLATLRTRPVVVKVMCVGGAIVAMNGVAAIRPVGWAVCVGGFAVGAAAWLGTRRAWVGFAGIAAVALAVTYLGQRADIQRRLLRQFHTVAIIHLGNVETTGYGYKLLDPYFYTRWMVNNTVAYMQFDEALRYALRAFASFFTVPTPWQVVSTSALVFLPQQVLWYTAIVMAVVGAGAGLRRDAWLTCLLVGYCLVGAAVISLPSGNIGTFIRMRDMVMPFVFCLAGLGAVVTIETVARRWHRADASRAIHDTIGGLHATAR